MENKAFLNQNEDSRGGPSPGWTEQSQTHPTEDDDIDGVPFDGRHFDPAHTYDSSQGAYQQYGYDQLVERGSSRSDDGARWRDLPSASATSARSQNDGMQSSKYNKDYGEEPERKGREKGYRQGIDESSGNRNRRSRSKDRERDRGTDRRDHERSRDRERRNRRDDSGNERADSDHRPRRRSRSRDRDRSDRDRRYRDSDRDRRHRDSDRGDRPRRDHDRDRGGDRDTSSKEIPWVPPPLPEHLRHLQVQQALTPAVSGSTQQASSMWSSQTALPKPIVQNQFQNDGSFLEMFRQKMQSRIAEGPAAASDDSQLSEGPSTSASVVAVPVEVAKPPAVATGPTLPANSSGTPVIAKRRISKILKTGIVQKKKKEEEEEEDKDGDSWNSYMKEVKRYRANKCIENEAGRPSLVK